MSLVYVSLLRGRATNHQETSMLSCDRGGLCLPVVALVDAVFSIRVSACMTFLLSVCLCPFFLPDRDREAGQLAVLYKDNLELHEQVG